MVWDLNGGVDEDDFVISSDGELRFKDPKAFTRGPAIADSAGLVDGEAGYIPTYDNSGNEYQVVVSDDESGLQSTQEVTVTVNDALAPQSMEFQQIFLVQVCLR